MKDLSPSTKDTSMGKDVMTLVKKSLTMSHTFNNFTPPDELNYDLELKRKVTLEDVRTQRISTIF